MDRITTPEHYKAVVADAKARGCRLSNCFFLPETIRRMTAAGTLYCAAVGNGLLLLDDNGGFYRCYYFLDGQGQPDRVSLDRDAVIEFPYNGEMNEKQRRQVEMIEAMGFRLGRESGLMSAPADIVASGRAAALPSAGVRAARAGDAARIMQLLKDNFNPLFAFLPTPRELDDAIREQRALVVSDGDGIAGMLLSSFDKRTATVNQVAVDSACRKRGYGRGLMAAYHALYADRAAVYQHWVDLHNGPAVGMYRGLGYEFSMRRANEYIKQAERKDDT